MDGRRRASSLAVCVIDAVRYVSNWLMSMTIHNRRGRNLSVRFSEEEYSEIEEVSRVGRSRSVSEFARNILLLCARTMSGPKGLLAEDLSTLSVQLSDLDSALVTLRYKLCRILGSVEKVGKP